MGFARSEVFGAQQRHQHVDGHGDRGGDVEGGDNHGQTRLKSTA
jgi:hypothetical protein